MMSLEDQLRATMHATAAEIPADPPPLRLGAPVLSPRRRPWSRPARRGWNTWLAPLAAAVVVVAVVLGSLVLTRSGSGTAAPAPAAPVTPAGLAGVPPYYVAVVTLPAKSGTSGVLTDAQVRSTATGAVLATVTAPKPYVAFAGVTAAADDRTFVLDAEGASSAQQRLFVLRINPTARSSRVSLRALPASFVPAGEAGLDLALSPDGTSLATETTTGTVMRLTVSNLVTGARRGWSFSWPSEPTGAKLAGSSYAANILGGLSWTADGQHVAFTGPGASADSFALRLLDTRDPGPNALAASKPIPAPAAPATTEEVLTGATITPDGRTAVFTVMLTTPDGSRTVPPRQQLVRVSAATGRVTAILGTPKGLDARTLGEAQILYTNATGSALVVSYFPGTTAGIWHGDSYTPIPWTGGPPSAAW